MPETSDFVSDDERPENRIVPDAVFALENLETGARGLFCLETDRGTERLTSGAEGSYSVLEKFRLYERYLRGGRFAARYAGEGTFRHFTLLFVTTSWERIANIRQLSSRLDPELHPYFKLGLFSEAVSDLCDPIWVSRDARDETRTGIVRERASQPARGNSCN